MIPALPFGKLNGRGHIDGTIIWQLTLKVKRCFAETWRIDERGSFEPPMQQVCGRSRCFEPQEHYQSSETEAVESKDKRPHPCLASLA